MAYLIEYAFISLLVAVAGLDASQAVLAAVFGG
jgi:hypothetical protein